jgi:hypothetical protein
MRWLLTPRAACTAESAELAAAFKTRLWPESIIVRRQAREFRTSWPKAVNCLKADFWSGASRPMAVRRCTRSVEMEMG